MNVILDSSGWIELLADAGRAHFFHPALQGELLVPSIVRYEVVRYALHRGPIGGAEAATKALRMFREVPLDGHLADAAARMASRHHLATADAIIYATAQHHAAELWTQDPHFKDLAEVRYFEKR